MSPLLLIFVIFCAALNLQNAVAYNATVTSRAGRTCSIENGQPATCKNSPQFKDYVKKLVTEMKQAIKPLPKLKLPEVDKIGEALSYYGSGSTVCASIRKYYCNNADTRVIFIVIYR